MKQLYATLFVVLGLYPFVGHAQVLDAWDFHDVPSPGTYNSFGYERAIQSNPAQGFSEGLLTRGSGVSVGDTLIGGFTGHYWTDGSLAAAVAANRYYEADVSCMVPFPVTSFNTLDYYINRSLAGPTWVQWEYSTDNFATPGIRLGDSVHFTTFDSNGVSQPQLNLRSLMPPMYSAGEFYFRLYAWGATDTAATFAIGSPPTGYSLNFTGVQFRGPSELLLSPLDAGLSGFTTTAGTPSAAQKIFLGGQAITENVTITASANFEFSVDSITFTDSLQVAPGADGSVGGANGNTFYVRIKASAPVGPVNDTAYATCPNVLPGGPVPLSGTVTGAAPLTLSFNNIQFGYAAAGTTVDKKLTVTGNGLTSDITLTSEGSFLVSADSLTFSTSVTIGHDTANRSTPVFVRFAPGDDNSQFIDSLQVSVASDTTVNVHLQGNSISPTYTINMASWYLDGFGSPQANVGPADKSLQESNVAAILPGLKADVYALQGVVSEPALATIVAGMPGYAYVISNYGSHSNPFDTVDPLLDSVEKLAFVYNTAKLANIHTDSLLTTGVNLAPDVATRYYSDWAGGRYPYMLTADVTLASPSGPSTVKTIHFINIHGQADSGNGMATYTGRHNAAFALDSLIKKNYVNENVVVLGDFNDDLSHTITPGMDTTSYSPFIDDSLLYSFPTRLLSQQGQQTSVNGVGVIDNVIVNNNMAAWYLPSSAAVLSDVSGLAASYGTTTSTNYPVSSQFSYTPFGTLPVTLLDFTATRQDVTALLSWTTTRENNSASFDVQRSGDNTTFISIGTVAAQGMTSTTTNYSFTDPQPLAGNNYYRLKEIDLDGSSAYSKTDVLSFGSLTISISPNPAHGTTNLFVSNAASAFFIQVVDMNGQIVWQLQTTPGTSNTPMDVSRLAKGIYMVKVISAAGIDMRKLLVQ